jgi:protein ERP2
MQTFYSQYKLKATISDMRFFLQMESSAQEVHKNLISILDYQTHHRLREAQGRKRAEELNERVLWWSVMETFSILFIAVSQVFILKTFFTDRSPSQSY